MADHMLARPDYQTTVDRLVGDLRPVTRLGSLRFALGAWMAVSGVLLAAAASVRRPDLADRATHVGYVLELVALGAVTLLLAILALRSAEPDRIPSRREQALGWLLAALAVATIAVHPVAADTSLGAFLAVGRGCAWATVKFALLPVVLLFAAVRRGAPLQPRSGGAFAAAGGLVLAYLAMRLHCPIDDGAHLFVWHLLPVVIGTAIGAGLGGRWLARWNR